MEIEKLKQKFAEKNIGVSMKGLMDCLLVNIIK